MRDLQEAVPRRYPALQTISGIFRILGWLTIVLGSIGAIASASAVDTTEDGSGVAIAAFLIGGIVGSVITGVFFIALADLILVAVDIERNTRGRASYELEPEPKEIRSRPPGAPAERTASDSSKGHPDAASPDWHFAHLGRAYFDHLVGNLKREDFWPIKYIWTSRTTVSYAKGKGTLRPHWIVEKLDGDRRSSLSALDEEDMLRWEFDEINSAYHFQ